MKIRSARHPADSHPRPAHPSNAYPYTLQWEVGQESMNLNEREHVATLKTQGPATLCAVGAPQQPTTSSELPPPSPPCIMTRYSHDCSTAVTAQHIVGHPDGDGLSSGGVAGVGTCRFEFRVVGFECLWVSDLIYLAAYAASYSHA